MAILNYISSQDIHEGLIPITGHGMSEEFKTSKARAERCVTHHHACDCREYKFQELEAQLAALEGRSAAAHMKYQGELETKVVKLTKQLAELRSGYECYCPNCAAKLKVSPKSIALLESSK